MIALLDRWRLSIIWCVSVTALSAGTAAPAVVHFLAQPMGARRLLVGRLIIAIGCVYEIVALFSGWPTITELVKRALEHRWLRFLVWLAAGAVIDHFWGN